MSHSITEYHISQNINEYHRITQNITYHIISNNVSEYTLPQFTQNNTYSKTTTTEQHKQQINWKSAGHAPLAFALHMRKKQGETLSEGGRRVPTS